jgi:hypothetical protein
MENLMVANTGSSLVIEFIRNGEHHRTVRWTSDNTLLTDMQKQRQFEEIKAQYEQLGADVLKISKLETIEVAIS